VTRFVVDRSPRGLVVVSGPDATSFLQSLVSQDLDPVADGAAVPTLLLTPQGKLDVVLRALRVGDAWWLDTDAAYGPRLAAALTRFRIRVKVELDDRTATTGLASLAGVDVEPPAGVYAIPSRWGEHAGIDLLGPRSAVAAALDALPPDVPRWDAARWEVFRIEAGVPRLGVDVDDATIPQEAFLERDAVSFTKGCFLGQELVCRIDTRGHVNRYLRRLDVASGAVPPAGATLVVDGRERGVVTSAATDPDARRVVALAMVRREVEPPAEARVQWDGHDEPVEVRAL
jgi:tRNA-modifying protein YgfZ